MVITLKSREEFCTCGTDPNGVPVLDKNCSMHRVRASRWSAKREELFQVGETIILLGKSLSESPYFLANPYVMTLNELTRYINDELQRMNDRNER